MKSMVLIDSVDKERIQTKARIGRYLMQAGGAARKVPAFSDLVFEKDPFKKSVSPDDVDTKVILGARHAQNPMKLDMPIMIAAMSYGALSKPAKIALAKGSNKAGTATNTGEGGMMPEERENAGTLIYQCLAGRFGWNIRNMVKADALEILISQGAKPGMGGHLMAEKITEEIAAIRGLPPGIDLRSPGRHADILGADDLIIKIEEFREATDWKIPISLKLAMGRIKDDIRIAANCETDIIMLDGMQGGTGAAPQPVMDNLGIPTVCGTAAAAKILKEIGRNNQVDIVVMGGVRTGADIAKALALGAKAVNVGMGSLMAMGCIGCRKCFTGKCPKGIATQDKRLTDRLDVDKAAEGVYSYLTALNNEVKSIAAELGKTNISQFEPSDLKALTPDVSAMTGVPLMGSG